MDVVDIGNEYAERFLDAARERQRRAAQGDGKAATGRCLNCGDKLDVGIYCDDECKADHEHRERVRRSTFATPAL